MKSERLSLVLCFLLMMNFTSLSVEAYRFVVGGKDGWTLKPSENYNHWAERMRFQVNDTLSFKYNKGSDSVLVVSKDDYDKCNTGNPIVNFYDGDSTFKFDKSGPFYFISGNKSNCDQGQKLVIIVLAIRNFPKPVPIAPGLATPTPSSGPTPVPAFNSPSPSPAVMAPVPVPVPLAPSRSPVILAPSPSPVVRSPGISPAGQPPAPSPLSKGPVTSPAPEDSPADLFSPAPAKSASPAFTTNSVLLGSLLLIVFGGFVSY